MYSLILILGGRGLKSRRAHGVARELEIWTKYRYDLPVFGSTSTTRSGKDDFGSLGIYLYTNLQYFNGSRALMLFNHLYVRVCGLEMIGLNFTGYRPESKSNTILQYYKAFWSV